MDQDGDFSTGAATGARMIVTALISAVVTATLVIAIGQSMMGRTNVASSEPQAVLIRTSG